MYDRMSSIVSRFVIYMDICLLDMPVHIYDLWVEMDILSMWEVRL